MTARTEGNRSAGPRRWWVFSARGELWSSLLSGALLLAGVTAWLAMGRSPEGKSVQHALSWISLAIGLVHSVRAAWDSVRAWRFEIDALMVLGALLAAYIGHPWEGSLLLFLFVLSGALEDLASQRTQRAVEALHKLMPTKALRLDATTGEWQTVTPEELGPGDVVKVLPGESIPADGTVSLGRTSVDQANLTGESVPRSVDVGDDVFAGTINAGDPVQVRVTRRAGESSLQRVLDLVLRAQQQREPVQRVIDKVNQPYAVGVLVASLAVFAAWYWGFGDGFERSMFTAITLLIVASPCAVIIATPTATLAAIARGARAGVLFKGGQSIERLARLAAIAFDKTGTLTVGKMRVQSLHSVGWSDERSLLAAAAGLEQDSTHPIATAVRKRAEEEGVEPAHGLKPRAFPGRGVEAEIDGKLARLGTLVHVEELVPTCLRASVREVLRGVQRRGQIGTVVAHNEQAGVIILSDTVRPGADRLVQELHTLGVKPVVMLTGDNRTTAAAVAESLGLDRFEAELLPEDKLKAVAAMREELRARRNPGGVGVIGDGVNDAPALAAADVSIAIGSIGSDAALESADIVLLTDDLGVVPWAVSLARRARRTVMFNLTFALSAIVVMSIATLVGARLGVPLPLWMGVLGHEGGTLLVVGNSLLLLGLAGPRRSIEDIRSGGETAPETHSRGLVASDLGRPMEV
jgi:Cd2+/Zn2+-exporting ATPase